MINKVPGGWKVYSEGGKALSKVLKSYQDALKRLRAVEYFKAHDSGRDQG